MLPGRGSQGQQSRRARGAMAWWGWLASLSLPGWLIWVHGIGYSVRLQCLEQMWSRDDRLPEAQEQTICQSDGPRGRRQCAASASTQPASIGSPGSSARSCSQSSWLFWRGFQRGDELRTDHPKFARKPAAQGHFTTAFGENSTHKRTGPQLTQTNGFQALRLI